MTDMHVQCHLEKPNPEGTGMTQDTVWIPKRFAQVGKFIKVRDPKSKEWEDGWKVTACYTEAPSKQVLERSQDYKNTRDASDI